MKKYKLIIETETDSDYQLIFPHIRFPHKIEYSGDYRVEIDFNNFTNAKKDIITFLQGLNIKTRKEYLENDFKNGMKDYLKILSKGKIQSSVELLGGGNWSFIIHIMLTTEEYL
jgi:hypothetical protein